MEILFITLGSTYSHLKAQLDAVFKTDQPKPKIPVQVVIGQRFRVKNYNTSIFQLNINNMINMIILIFKNMLPWQLFDLYGTLSYRTRNHLRCTILQGFR